MKQFLYVTGNAAKFRQADAVCRPVDIILTQTELDIIEIQSDNAEAIANDKAEKAFMELQKPVVVSDDSWIIPGLKGFPGPYMKYVNGWFEIEDWINLTAKLEDRRIILRQVVVFKDDHDEHVFSKDIEGILMREARGQSKYNHASIVSFDGGIHSNAEFHERDESSTEDIRNVWHDFVEWHNR